MDFLLPLCVAFFQVILAMIPLATAIDPTIHLNGATFLGTTDGVVNKFLGIPYARPPVGELRFNHPLAVEAYVGTHSATEFGPSCPQQHVEAATNLPPDLDMDVTIKIITVLSNSSVPQSEDCLTVNIWAPANIHPESKLPIAVWIYGGGFQIGSGAQYDGSVLVERSIQLGEPMLFVSMNYRVAAFGFLPGVEAQTEKIGNLGYRDQRLALEWIQAYIHEFGGDPTKVTIFGESAGAIAAVAHMTTNGGNNEGLFRGAFLQSGSLVPMGDMQGAQLYYDALVIAVGCDGASDTLECLRGVPYEKLKAAMDEAPSFFGYSSVALSWGPRTDGDFLRDSPRQLAFEGSISRIPVVIGSCEDEGTLFTLSSLNITTTEDLRVYLSTIIFPAASLSDVDNLLHMYPEDPALGAPFHTGILNSPTPHFKRLAAILGDLVFESPKRLFLDMRAEKQDIWAYLYKRRKNTAVLGTAHVTDAIDMFGPSEITDHLIHFVTYLDPNGLTATQVPQHQAALHSANAVNWPKYDPHSKLMLAYVDGPSRASVVRNTDREEQVTYMSTWSSKFWLR